MSPGTRTTRPTYAHPAVTTSGHLTKAATRRLSVKRRSGRRERAWLLWAGTARRWPASLDVSTTVTRYWRSVQGPVVGLDLISDGTGQITGHDLVEMPS